MHRSNRNKVVVGNQRRRATLFGMAEDTDGGFKPGINTGRPLTIKLLSKLKAGFVKRDPRVKERKKYGQRSARARFQFSKR
jgi:hypothetical protein